MNAERRNLIQTRSYDSCSNLTPSAFFNERLNYAVLNVYLQPLTISEVEDYHSVDSTEQTEEVSRLDDEQPQSVENFVKKSKLLA